MKKTWESARCYGRLPIWPGDVAALGRVMTDWPLAGRGPADSDWVKGIAEQAGNMQYPLTDELAFLEVQMICLRTDNTVVGATFCQVRGKTASDAGIAIHPDHRRKGYMREAVIAAGRFSHNAGRAEISTSVFAVSEQSEGARAFLNDLPGAVVGSGQNSAGQIVKHFGFNRAEWATWLALTKNKTFKVAHYAAHFTGHPDVAAAEEAPAAEAPTDETPDEDG